MPNAHKSTGGECLQIEVRRAPGDVGRIAANQGMGEADVQCGLLGFCFEIESEGTVENEIQPVFDPPSGGQLGALWALRWRQSLRDNLPIRVRNGEMLLQIRS